MTNRSVTMKDVAKLAGVSQPTVSYVINGTASISPEVTERVLRAIEETGYQPNAFAQNLKRSSSSTIAVLIPDLVNPYYASVSQEIEQYLSQKGYFTYLACSNSDPATEESYIKSFLQHKVSGILIFSLVNRQLYKLIANTGTPMVLLDDQSNTFHLPYLHIRNQEGAMTAVEYLHDSGCQKIGFVSEPLVKLSIKERWKGFEQIYKKYYPDNPADHAITLSCAGNTYRSGYDLAEKLLEDGYDGLFVTSDFLACGLIKKLGALHVDIPEQISIIGYDGLYISDLITPALSTMQQPISEICHEGANMLLDIIHTGQYKQVQELRPTLLLRETTKKLDPR
ncbi:MAG: LacI family DNA-binding transcriptional regulator [Lachnospiraceae bacterium]|nr:LacI family DNA-binding transcriptional regulator [Lachnospiraceae bacterium]